MITLAIVGVVSGAITAISPCVLPVLPAILATAAPPSTLRAALPDATRPAPTASTNRRPLVLVAGLVASFGVFTLVGGSLLSALHLPADFLRWTGIVVLGVVGLGLLVPPLGDLLAKPFERIRLPERWRTGGAFGVGAALGLVFVPCAGPILTAITVQAATGGIGWRLVVLTAAFCLGLAIPLLGFALAGRAIGARVAAVRSRLRTLRAASGAILVATALVIATNVAEPLQRFVPTYQSSLENSQTVRDEIARLSGEPSETAATFYACARDSAVLANCGPARDLPGIEAWLNTDGEALTLDELRGKVVLIDFWTYSCINCQRTLPFLEAWYDRYASDGLVIIGVHTPEFAFEKVESNVADAAARLGVRYPIALDNDYETWKAWDQNYWPAHYLIDRDGIVRQVHYGEGGYAETEALIQQLLGQPATAPFAADEGSHTAGQSPETYLGSLRTGGFYNDDGIAGEPFSFALKADLPRDVPSLGGVWSIQPEYALAIDDAVLAYRFYGAEVNLVLGGEGTVRVTLAGDPGAATTIEVTGTPTLYTLYSGPAVEDVMTLEFDDGVQAYAFTFG